MTRTLATLIGLLGLVGALYLFVTGGELQPPGLGNHSGIDGPLFGVAIAVISILVLVTGRSQRGPDAGDSLSM